MAWRDEYEQNLRALRYTANHMLEGAHYLIVVSLIWLAAEHIFHGFLFVLKWAVFLALVIHWTGDILELRKLNDRRKMITSTAAQSILFVGLLYALFDLVPKLAAVVSH
jgi:predicted PurR-regulated permease PerM